MNVRTVTVRGVTYVRGSDVAEMLRELASSEETDARNRLLQLAENLEESCGKSALQGLDDAIRRAKERIASTKKEAGGEER